MTLLSLPFVKHIWKENSSCFRLEKLPEHISDQLIDQMKTYLPGIEINPFRKMIEENVSHKSPKIKTSFEYKTDVSIISFDSPPIIPVSSKMKRIPKGKKSKDSEQKESPVELINITLSPCRLSIIWKFREIELTVHGVFINNEINFYPHPFIFKLWSGYPSFSAACSKDFIYYNEEELTKKTDKEIVKLFRHILQIAHVVPPKNHHGLVSIKKGNSDFSGTPIYKAKCHSSYRAGIFHVATSDARYDVHPSCQAIPKDKITDFNLLEASQFKSTH